MTNLLNQIIFILLQAIDLVIFTRQQASDSIFAAFQVLFSCLKTISLSLELAQLLNQVFLLVGLSGKERIILLQKDA